ncbi:hypothetical protein [Virgisporangium aurantiacum]|uniref:Lipoprotein n=1 Tax=Virgisporangium aurantiacum TaxID=175570 RepID=A0A8J3ZJZ3_9ACTN|nr:hypothetical protein [Virgisporangium aurantiacum]GIJ64342.1 hypothetical protein Vau01_118580 [Virgisporangium aurantiacum]
MTRQMFPTPTRTVREVGLLLAVAAALATVLALTGCSGSDEDGGVASAGDGPNATSSANAAQRGDSLKFAQCMRENGVPDFKDPGGDSGGGALIPQGTDQDVVKAAMEKCKQYSPNGGEPPQIDAESIERQRKFAQCMRENGVPDFPDPEGDTGGSGSQLKGVDTKSEAFKSAQEKCEQLVPRPSGTGPGRTR